MAAPKPVVLTQAATWTGNYEPEPLVVIGDIGDISPQAAPAVDATPADATAVATDLQSVVDALVAAGIFTQ